MDIECEVILYRDSLPIRDSLLDESVDQSTDDEQLDAIVDAYLLAFNSQLYIIIRNRIDAMYEPNDLQIWVVREQFGLEARNLHTSFLKDCKFILSHDTVVRCYEIFRRHSSIYHIYDIAIALASKYQIWCIVLELYKAKAFWRLCMLYGKDKDDIHRGHAHSCMREYYRLAKAYRVGMFRAPKDRTISKMMNILHQYDNKRVGNDFRLACEHYMMKR